MLGVHLSEIGIDNVLDARISLLVAGARRRGGTLCVKRFADLLRGAGQCACLGHDGVSVSPAIALQAAK